MDKDTRAEGEMFTDYALGAEARRYGRMTVEMRSVDGRGNDAREEIRFEIRA